METAEAKDHAEIALTFEIAEDKRHLLSQHRAQLDEWLAAPIGTGARNDRDLLDYITGITGVA